jgi:hypothetical protein
VDIVKIFLSHNTKYIDLATYLKNSLHALEIKPSTQLDIKISEEMAGATDWRQWIEDNVRSADIFLLLFPHASIDMSWCTYELGRFYDGKRKIVCIKNTDIPSPPPPFQPYQAYDGDEAGILKFINELFVKGTFTDNKPLNPKLGSAGEEIYGKAENIARQLARKFAQARLREQFYEWRIVLSVQYDAANQFDPDASTVKGNADGMQLLGFSETQTVSWSAVRRSIGDAKDWPLVLERAIPSITAGALPPPLPPFPASGTLYIPVIARALSVDGLLTELALIFVAADTDRFRRRARWDILEPRYQEAKYRSPTPARCAEITRSLLEDYDRLQQDALDSGVQGVDKFYGVFSRDLRPDVAACGDEWAKLLDAMRAAAPQSAQALVGQLESLRANNAKWLGLAARQFVDAVGDFH